MVYNDLVGIQNFTDSTPDNYQTIVIDSTTTGYGGIFTTAPANNITTGDTTVDEYQDLGI